jgi:hypothetical protein
MGPLPDLNAINRRLYKFFLDHDVLLRPLGNVIYVLPPYSIIREELDYVYEVIEEAQEATALQIGRVKNPQAFRRSARRRVDHRQGPLVRQQTGHLKPICKDHPHLRSKESTSVVALLLGWGNEVLVGLT